MNSWSPSSLAAKHLRGLLLTGSPGCGLNYCTAVGHPRGAQLSVTRGVTPVSHPCTAVSHPWGAGLKPPLTPPGVGAPPSYPERLFPYAPPGAGAAHVWSNPLGGWHYGVRCQSKGDLTNDPVSHPQVQLATLTGCSNVSHRGVHHKACME